MSQAIDQRDADATSASRVAVLTGHDPALCTASTRRATAETSHSLQILRQQTTTSVRVLCGERR
jgi:hypothetical protein